MSRVFLRLQHVHTRLPAFLCSLARATAAEPFSSAAKADKRMQKSAK